jgi:hypothetical protein
MGVGLLIIPTILGGGAACMWVALKYRNMLQNYFGSLCINLIYYYSYATIHIRKAISYVYTPMSRNTLSTNNCKMYYIQDGMTVSIRDNMNHNQPIAFLPNMDVLVYTTPALDVIVLESSEKVVDLYKAKSDTEFMNISVKFDCDSTHYDISFRDDTYNFYAVGNHINKHIIWRLVLNQHNVDLTGRDYTIHLIDHNVNMVSYTQYASIVIQKEGYYIQQAECNPIATEDEVIVNSRKGLDK